MWGGTVGSEAKRKANGAVPVDTKEEESGPRMAPKGWKRKRE